jgi:hypothetical protein
VLPAPEKVQGLSSHVRVTGDARERPMFPPQKFRKRVKQQVLIPLRIHTSHCVNRA